MKGALGEINFLADSPHRSAILARLHEGPCTRAGLGAATGASSATLSRVLRAFERREWIARTDQRYELTPLGAFVAVGFETLLQWMETEQQLQGLWKRMPTGLLAFDPQWVADATITLSRRDDPLAPMDRAAEIERGAARSRVLTYALPEPCLSAHRHGITTGTHRVEAVITRDVVRTVAGTAHAPWFGDALPTDRLEVFVSDSDVPHVIGINDDAVYFGVTDERGAPLALIETGDETVFTWAEWIFETYRREAVVLTPETFSRLADADGSDGHSPSDPELIVEK